MKTTVMILAASTVLAACAAEEQVARPFRPLASGGSR